MILHNFKKPIEEILKTLGYKRVNEYKSLCIWKRDIGRTTVCGTTEEILLYHMSMVVTLETKNPDFQKRYFLNEIK